jgi:hypothetical protein
MFHDQLPADPGRAILPEEKSKAGIIRVKDHRLAEKEFYLRPVPLAGGRVQIKDLIPGAVIVPFQEECSGEAEERMPGL